MLEGVNLSLSDGKLSNNHPRLRDSGSTTSEDSYESGVAQVRSKGIVSVRGPKDFAQKCKMRFNDEMFNVRICAKRRLWFLGRDTALSWHRKLPSGHDRHCRSL